MNNKGVLGLDTTKTVIISFLVLAVLVLAMFLVVANLRDTFESTESKQTGRIDNETLTSVTETGEELSIYRLRNCQFTTLVITNATTNNTDGAFSSTIPATNYTTSNCKISTKTGIIIGQFNNTNWNVTGTYTYNSAYANDLAGNVSIGPANFFKQTVTVFTLLGVVLIILAIAIIIVAVTRFGLGGGSGGRSSSSDEL